MDLLSTLGFTTVGKIVEDDNNLIQGTSSAFSTRSGNNIYDNSISDDVNKQEYILSTLKYLPSLDPNSRIVNKDLRRELSDDIFATKQQKKEEQKKEEKRNINYPTPFRPESENLIQLGSNKTDNISSYYVSDNIINFEKNSNKVGEPLSEYSTFFPTDATLMPNNPGFPLIREPDTLNAELDKKLMESFSNNIMEDNYNSLFSGQSLIGGAVQPHKNMVPFFKRSQTQNTKDFISQQTLETFTGQNPYFRQSGQKREIESMFEPQPDVGYVHGAPNVDLREYFIPSYKKQGEKPFPEIKVRSGRLGDPNDLGIAMGQTTDAGDGFHPMVRVLDKTVDELRVKPKVSYEGRLISGKNFTTMPGLQGQLGKHNPDRFYTNAGLERVFTTGGQEVKSMVRSEYILKNTNGGTELNYATPAKASVDKYIPQKLQPMYSGPFKTTYKGDYHHNAGNTVGKATGSTLESRQKNYLIYSNERDITGKRSITSANTSSTQQEYFRSKDFIANTTLRESTEKNTVSGVVTGVEASKNIVQFTDLARNTGRQTLGSDTITATLTGQNEQKGTTQFTDSSNTTIRETTERNTTTGGVTGVEASKNIVPFTDSSNTTIRETTERNTTSGGITGVEASKNIVPFTDISNTTIRETTERNTTTASLVGVEASKNIAPFTDTSNTTIRETTEKNTVTGGLKGVEADKVIAPYTDDAKGTMRMISENQTRVSAATGVEASRRIAPYTDSADTTHRETIEDQTRVTAPSYNRGEGHITNVYDARPTIRESMSDIELINHPNNNESGQVVYDSYYNADLNDRKEIIAQGRTPTEEKAKIYSGVDIYFAKTQHNKRQNAYKNNNNLRASSFNPTYSGKENELYTRNKKEYRNLNNNQYDPVVLDAFRSNPYTQSLSSFY